MTLKITTVLPPNKRLCILTEQIINGFRFYDEIHLTDTEYYRRNCLYEYGKKRGNLKTLFPNLNVSKLK